MTDPHQLKCWPQFFEALLDGRKTWEVRKNDRGFKEGDELLLLEWQPPGPTCVFVVSDGMACGNPAEGHFWTHAFTPAPGAYTGRSLSLNVDDHTELPCMPGFVGMTVSRIEVDDESEE